MSMDKTETTQWTETTEVKTSDAEQTAPAKPELEHTQIYRCNDKECKAWVRVEFYTGACPICKGSMATTYKFLPPVDKKTKKKWTTKSKK